MKTLYRALAVATAGCLLTASTLAAENEQAMLRNAPIDNKPLADRALECQHWSSAEVTSQADDERVEQELAEHSCGTIAADADALRRKYARSETALKAIDAAVSLGF